MISIMRARVIVALAVILLLALLVGGAYVCTRYYGFVFAKSVSGEVIGIERVNQPAAIISGGSAVPAEQLFSFAVAIRDVKGEIHTASSEDRQWALVVKGNCAEASFQPYPPWHLEKFRTYHGARLIRLYDCPK